MAVNKIRRNGSYAPLSANYYKDDAVDEAGLDAELLFVRGLAFCADVLSDGFISDRQLVRFVGIGMPDVEDRAKRLVKSGLWDRVDGGFLVRSWLEWNRSRDEIASYQAKDRVRKRSERSPSGVQQESETPSERSPEDAPKHRPSGVQPRARTPRHDTTRQDSGYVGSVGSPELRTRPDEATTATAPDGTPPPPTSKPLPADWQPPDVLRQLAAVKGLDPDHETDQFRAHAAAHGRVFANPNEGFRLWIGNAYARGPRRSTPPAPSLDRPLTRDEVRDILGDEQPPYPPQEVCAKGQDAKKAWARENLPLWHAERERQARRMLARRQAT